MTFSKFLLVLALMLTERALAKNPVMSGADPHVVALDGEFWLYPTRSIGGGHFWAYASKDLVRWKEHGPVLDFQTIGWIGKDGRRFHGAWAPCLGVKDGKYYFYYSVGPQTERHPSRIGVAVSDSPAGPFHDSGQPLLTGGNGFEAIDPMVFKDPVSLRYFFYSGGSNGATLRTFEMNQDMVSFAREIPTKTPDKFTEAPFLHYHEGLYYLTYSHGNYRDETYSVHYATSRNPYGPWRYRGVLLESDEHHKGPGHHSLFRNRNGDWFIAYHRWNHRVGPGPYSGSREIAIDRIEYDAQGLLRPVVMTDEGVNVPMPGGGQSTEEITIQRTEIDCSCIIETSASAASTVAPGDRYQFRFDFVPGTDGQ